MDGVSRDQRSERNYSIHVEMKRGASVKTAYRKLCYSNAMNPADFLRETIDVVRQIENRFIELAGRLYKIRDKEMWKSSYESYGEFLEAARILPAQASILVAVYRNYVVLRGVPEANLSGIGYSTLYEAIPLLEKEQTDTVVEKARVLTRSEIQDEVREKTNGICTHEGKPFEVYHKCSCGKFYKV